MTVLFRCNLMHAIYIQLISTISNTLGKQKTFGITASVPIQILTMRNKNQVEIAGIRDTGCQQYVQHVSNHILKHYFSTSHRIHGVMDNGMVEVWSNNFVLFLYTIIILN